MVTLRLLPLVALLLLVSAASAICAHWTEVTGLGNTGTTTGQYVGGTTLAGQIFGQNMSNYTGDIAIISTYNPRANLSAGTHCLSLCAASGATTCGYGTNPTNLASMCTTQAINVGWNNWTLRSDGENVSLGGKGVYWAVNSSCNPYTDGFAMGYQAGSLWDTRYSANNSYPISVVFAGQDLAQKVWYCDTVVGNVTFSLNATGRPVNEATTLYAVPAGNSSAVTAWYWNVSYNSSYTIINSGVSGQTLTFTPNATGNWSVNITGTVAAANYSSLLTLVVVNRPTANFSQPSGAPHFIGSAITFNDASNCSGGGSPCSYWWWNFNDSTAVNTSQNVSKSFSQVGTYNVSLWVADYFGINSSTYHSENITVNGFMVDVLNELSGANVSCWTAVISNATQSITLSCQNNTYKYNSLNASFPSGSLGIAITASGYVGRSYYAYYGTSYYVDLTAYLLDTSSGIYPIFTVVDNTLSPLQSALVAAYRQIPALASVLVSQKYTDASGGAQMYLDPAATYDIVVTLTGYNPYSGSITPVAREYIIILESTASGNQTWFDSNDTFFITMQPYDPVLDVTTDYVTFTIHDPFNNLVYWNLTIVNSTGDWCKSYNSTASGGGIYNVSAATFTCIVPNGTRVYYWVDYERNTSSPYNFSGLWHTGGNYSNYSLAGIFTTATIDDEFKGMVAVAGVILAGVAVGSPLGAGVGALSMIGAALVFAWGGWLNPLWVGIALLMGLAAYTYSIRGGGAVG